MKEQDNVLLLHFNELRESFCENLQRIATFLDIDLDAALVDRIEEHCSFGYMKQNAALFAPVGGSLWHGGAESFVYKGTNQRWTNALTPDDVKEYYEHALDQLGDECTLWLSQGNDPWDLAILHDLIRARHAQHPPPEL